VGHDVVIVGGGSAGCALAARLSEDAGVQVLLLEAGPDYPTLEALPREIALGTELPVTHDWGFLSEPDEFEQVQPLPRGKLMGGSSAVNACFALRGSPADYDGWAVLGNEGWSFEDVLPSFTAAETDADFGHEPWHGNAGPCPIRRFPPEELSPLQAAFVEAAVAADHPRVDDHNRPWAVGAGPTPMNLAGGVRMSTAITYLRAARGRPNFEIRPDVLVDRLVINGGKATGVALAEPEEIVEAGAVVLAAGAYGSPGILMRSGIGPAALLNELGIDVLADISGVGENLIDHPRFAVAVPVDPDVTLGPWFQTTVTWHSRSADRSGPPDLQLFGSGPFATPDEAAFYVQAALLKPRSRGWVKLRSRDPSVPPRVHLGHLSEPHDVDRMAEAVGEASRVSLTEPLASLAVGAVQEFVDQDDPTLREQVRRGVLTYHHAVGTCRMGTDPEGGAVVDAKGKVHGIESLWVADASVMPDIPSANTNLPTIMVAERIASWLGG
jgi:choline dehydrogenase-like flavoprotein